MSLKILHIILFIAHQTSQVTSQSVGTGANYVRNFIESFLALPTLGIDIPITEIRTLAKLARDSGLYNEDAYLNISQLVNKYGYDFEEHFVTTQDGYILALHRIPGKGLPVLLVHGILLSSDDFVVAGPRSALAYYLASQGYDVWLANARGNKHSKRHVTLSPNQSEFFNFSWDEIGRYDIPANIDYILNVTGQQKLSYVGYSQGNTAFFVMCSEFPEYNDKITVKIALSPIAFFSRLFSPFVRFLFKINYFETQQAIGQPEFLPNSFLTSPICTQIPAMKFICSNIFNYLVFGFDRAQLNVTNLPVIFNHTPAGCSSKQFIHYKQVLNSGKFRRFDYGREGNMALYGMRFPPNYRLNRVTAPVALTYSFSDWWSSYVDVLKLRQNLPNVVDFHEVTQYNHLSYLYAQNVRPKVYERVLDLIRRYTT
ncbi:lipase 3-like [Pectinophora gossypiella]|uniref:lipase 3-like n=1 Tax=Pectinophora gossypiella TaxID=13191 RepID=UPI00214E24EB|nr:lipase 3-like [Pectinophora gossypiella]